ncbi:50S ribosomal protein L13 [archaeon]|jgi:large subunit ribosomal protein L13|nr:50S ribosomal protein L13 [archaeon]MBT7128969.1 50S ribosomal protein L13 [archaeon]
MGKIVYDGEGAVFGRLASVVAKDLLKGNEVDVLNCEKIIISGDKKLLAVKILAKREMGSGGSMKGPKYPRVADKLVKRMIRGMLPRDRAKGRDAFRELKVYVGGENKDAVKLNHRKPMKFASVAEIVRLLK